MHGPADEDGAEQPAATSGLDPARLASLYVEFGPELRRFLVGVLRDHDLAGDVLQATFAKVIEHGGVVREESVRGWLFRVALNEARLVRRRQQAQERGQGSLARMGEARHSPLEDSLVRGETVEAVRRMLQGLSEAERAVLRARIYDEKTFARIAEEQGVPLGTVLTRMRRALDKLRRGLTRGETQP